MQRKSLAAVGAAAGLTRQQLSKIELGAPRTAISQYEAIAIALGVSLADLFRASNPRRQHKNGSSVASG